MPLFRCSECNGVENTALGDYWSRHTAPLCSECSTGRWHGRFPKSDVDADGWVQEGNHPWFVTKPRTPTTDEGRGT